MKVQRSAIVSWILIVAILAVAFGIYPSNRDKATLLAMGLLSVVCAVQSICVVFTLFRQNGASTGAQRRLMWGLGLVFTLSLLSWAFKWRSIFEIPLAAGLAIAFGAMFVASFRWKLHRDVIDKIDKLGFSSIIYTILALFMLVLSCLVTMASFITSHFVFYAVTLGLNPISISALLINNQLRDHRESQRPPT